MSVQAISAFIVGGSILASFLTKALASFLASIKAKYGDLVSQFLLLVISFALAGVAIGFGLLPAKIVEMTAVIFGGAIVLYDVLYKAVYQQLIKGEKPL